MLTFPLSAKTCRESPAPGDSDKKGEPIGYFGARRPVEERERSLYFTIAGYDRVISINDAEDLAKRIPSWLALQQSPHPFPLLVK